MIWLLIWLGIIVFGFRGLFFDDLMKPDTVGGYFFVGLLYALTVGASALVLGGAAVGIGQAFPDHPVEGRHSILVAIRDKDGVEGRFFLGSGVVSNQSYYFYYERLQGGGYRPGKVRADQSVTVYEDARQDAEMVTYDWRITYPIWAWLVCLPDQQGSGHSYDFHVPSGTIKPGYAM